MWTGFIHRVPRSSWWIHDKNGQFRKSVCFPFLFLQEPRRTLIGHTKADFVNMDDAQRFSLLFTYETFRLASHPDTVWEIRRKHSFRIKINSRFVNVCSTVQFSWNLWLNLLCISCKNLVTLWCNSHNPKHSGCNRMNDVFSIEEVWAKIKLEMETYLDIWSLWISAMSNTKRKKYGKLLCPICLVLFFFFFNYVFIYLFVHVCYLL